MNGTPQRWSFYLLAGVTLLGVAGWELAENALERGSLKPARPALPPPDKVRSASRATSTDERFISDPIAAYIGRAKRGMTDNEIRWMIEDYRAAGIYLQGSFFPSDGGAHRRKEMAWYLVAMTEALQLTPEQQDQARSRMATLLQKDVDWAKMRACTISGKMSAVRIPDDTAVGLFGPPIWLQKEAFAPWKLADLTPEQTQVTLRNWIATHGDETPLPGMDGYVPQIQDPPTGGRYFQSSLAGTPSRYIPGTAIFPLTLDQQRPFLDHEQEGLKQGRVLHPAQLRMGLLIGGAALADEISVELGESPPVIASVNLFGPLIPTKPVSDVSVEPDYGVTVETDPPSPAPNTHLIFEDPAHPGVTIERDPIAQPEVQSPPSPPAEEDPGVTIETDPAVDPQVQPARPAQDPEETEPGVMIEPEVPEDPHPGVTIEKEEPASR